MLFPVLKMDVLWSGELRKLWSVTAVPHLSPSPGKGRQRAWSGVFWRKRNSAFYKNLACILNSPIEVSDRESWLEAEHTQGNAQSYN